MQVKIFQASGKDEIADLADEINEWSHTPPGKDIQFVDTAMCQIGKAGGERYQHYVVSVWHT